MKAVLTMYVIGLIFGQSFYGYYAYSIALISMFLIYTTGKKVFIQNDTYYTTGGALILIGASISTITSGSISSCLYVIMMTASFFVYPAFKFFQLHREHYLYIAIVCLVLSIPIGLGVDSGYHSLFGNPNNYASTLLCLAYLTLIGIPSKNKVAILFTFIYFIILIYYTNSRAVLAASLIFVCLYYFQKLFISKVMKTSLIVLIVIMFISYVTILLNDQFQLLAAIQNSNISAKSYNGLSYRDVLMYAAIESIQETPLGVGLGNSGVIMQQKIGAGLSPHNAFLKMAMEGGIVVFFGYLYILIVSIYKNKSILASSFIVALILRCLFESATPFTPSIVSAMLILPFFLNEFSFTYMQDSERLND